MLFFKFIFSESLKPLAAEDRRIEEEEKKVREQEAIAKAEAEGSLMSLDHVSDIACLHMHTPACCKILNILIPLFNSLLTANAPSILV